MITQEFNKLCAISGMMDSHLGQPLNDFINSHNIIEMDDLESDDGSVDTPLVSPFLDSDDKSDDGGVLNELNEYGNAGNFHRNKIINNLDGGDLSFPCMIGFRNFVAYFHTFLPMNIITRKAYNIIIVEGLKSTRRKLVGIVRDIYVFVGSVTYVTNFVVLEDIGEFIISDMMDIVMGRPFRVVTQLEYECVKGLILFNIIFDTYIFWMRHTIPRLKNFEWSEVSPILVLNQRDLMSGLREE
uniref:Protein kinase-like domain, concanavalin A-like lectin/glucanase domain protein n=1 Tax=Tanacetum cinerariifolium TaxID=118510 RepID=A0A6L2KE61_TANCI|nr:protein kinase-like domain, concanavalin A-like lectin/glucanase domain protein [Tanacetum cinerariifolium]